MLRHALDDLDFTAEAQGPNAQRVDQVIEGMPIDLSLVPPSAFPDGTSLSQPPYRSA